MKNLEKDQKEILNSLTKEFVELNSMQKHDHINDLFALIDSQINDKAVFKKEALAKTAAFDKINDKKVNGIIELINKLLSKYGYEAVLHFKSGIGSGRSYSEYYCVRIIWNGHLNNYRRSETSDFYIYTDQKCEYSTWHLVSTRLCITNDYSKRTGEMTVEELTKYIATEIIKKQQEKI